MPATALLPQGKLAASSCLQGSIPPGGTLPPGLNTLPLHHHGPVVIHSGHRREWSQCSTCHLRGRDVRARPAVLSPVR